MNAVFNFAGLLSRQLDRAMDLLAPVFQLGIRLYVTSVFLKSGLTKIDDFSSTIALFENEYRVPILSPEFAAYMGTGAELVLPLLLLLGVLSRPVAIALFVFNIVAVVSYPDISDAGRAYHFYWGGLIAVIAVFGAGRLSVDAWWKQRSPAMAM